MWSKASNFLSPVRISPDLTPILHAPSPLVISLGFFTSIFNETNSSSYWDNLHQHAWLMGILIDTKMSKSLHYCKMYVVARRSTSHIQWIHPQSNQEWYWDEPSQVGDLDTNKMTDVERIIKDKKLHQAFWIAEKIVEWKFYNWFRLYLLISLQRVSKHATIFYIAIIWSWQSN